MDATLDWCESLDDMGGGGGRQDVGAAGRLFKTGTGAAAAAATGRPAQQRPQKQQQHQQHFPGSVAALEEDDARRKRRAILQASLIVLFVSAGLLCHPDDDEDEDDDEEEEDEEDGLDTHEGKDGEGSRGRRRGPPRYDYPLLARVCTTSKRAIWRQPTTHFHASHLNARHARPDSHNTFAFLDMQHRNIARIRRVCQIILCTPSVHGETEPCTRHQRPVVDVDGHIRMHTCM